MGICQKLTQVSMYATLGFSQGVMPLVSYNYSSGDVKRMKGGVRYALTDCPGAMLVIVSLFVHFPEFFIRLFMDDPDVVEYGRHFLVGLILAQPFMCLDFMCVGVFQAVGLGLGSLIFAVLRKVVLEIPAIIVLNRLFPLYGLAYSQLTAEVVLACAAAGVLVWMFRRLDRGEPLRRR